jgi:hypothetical protein
MRALYLPSCSGGNDIDLPKTSIILKKDKKLLDNKIILVRFLRELGIPRINKHDLTEVQIVNIGYKLPLVVSWLLQNV